MGFGSRWALAGVVVVAASAGVASASVSIAIPFDKLVQTSTTVGLVTPVTQSSAWEAGHIFTYTVVHVDERVAGETLPETVTVRTMGGEVGDIGQAVEGEAVLTVGRPSLLFLHPSAAIPGDSSGLTSHAPTYSVTARAQGQFAVVLDASGELHIKRSSGIGELLAPRGAVLPVLAGATLHESKLDDAKTKIAAVWSRVHAP